MTGRETTCFSCILSLVAFCVTNLWYHFCVIMMLLWGESVVVPVRIYWKIAVSLLFAAAKSSHWDYQEFCLFKYDNPSTDSMCKIFLCFTEHTMLHWAWDACAPKVKYIFCKNPNMQVVHPLLRKGYFQQILTSFVLTFFLQTNKRRF